MSSDAYFSESIYRTIALISHITTKNNQTNCFNKHLIVVVEINFPKREKNVNKHYEYKKCVFSMLGKISHTSLEMIIIFLRILHLLKEIVFVMHARGLVGDVGRNNGAMFIFGMSEEHTVNNRFVDVCRQYRLYEEYCVRFVSKDER